MTTQPPAAPAIVRLRSPGEIVSAVPHLLGFAPERSVVVIGLHVKQIVLTCRVDLDDVVGEPCVQTVTEALERAGADRAVIVADGPTRDETAAALTAMSELLEADGISVLERLSVVGERWFHEDCADPRCCPPEGVPVADHDHAPSTMSFHALGGGYRPDRGAVVAECHPDRPLLTAAIRSEIHILVAGDREISDDDVSAALAAVLGWGDGQPPTAAQLALAATATADPLVRDVCYALFAPGVAGGLTPDLRELHECLSAAGTACGDLDGTGVLVDGDALDRVLRRVLAWVRNLPDDIPSVTMPALVVAAAAHWCDGDGARARTLVERALALDHEPLPMLLTLMSCISHGFRLTGAAEQPADRPGRGRRGRSVA